MADIFSKLGESIKTTIKEATGQTQKSVDQAVYRTEIISKKGELKKLYQALGEAHYNTYIKEQEDTELTTLYAKITTLIEEIKNAEQKVDDIVNTQKDSFDSFKREVKTTWEDPMPSQSEAGADDVEVIKVCENCNTGNHEYAAYCITCGKKFE